MEKSDFQIQNSKQIFKVMWNNKDLVIFFMNYNQRLYHLNYNKFYLYTLIKNSIIINLTFY